MKYIVLLALFSFQFVVAQSKAVRNFEKEVNKNLRLIQQNRLDLKESGDYFGPTSTEVINPFFEDDFEIIEPFRIDENGNISMKIKYLNEEDPFIYSVNANLEDVESFVVDIYFLLNFNEDQLSVQYEYLNSGVVETGKNSYLHLGVDQSKMRKYAAKIGFDDAGFYP